MPQEDGVYEVIYIDDAGQEHRCKLASAAGLPFHKNQPVREPKAYRKQRHLSGYYFFSTAGVLVFYESRLEMSSLMRMDFDRNIVAVAAQPFRLLYKRGNKERSHVPDYFARLKNGQELVVDVKPASFATRPRNREVFKVTADACEKAGWKYKVDVGAGEPLISNIRWLSGYKRQPHSSHFKKYADAVVDLCADKPRTIRSLIAEVGKPAEMRPIIFHLLWNGIVQTDLDRLLTDESSISLPDTGRSEAYAFYA